MKKLVSAAILFGFVLSSTYGHALQTCIKCHKTKEKVAENVKKSGAKTPDELLNFLRNTSPKKALHKNVSDDEIKNTFAEVTQK